MVGDLRDTIPDFVMSRLGHVPHHPPRHHLSARRVRVSYKLVIFERQFLNNRYAGVHAPPRCPPIYPALCSGTSTVQVNHFVTRTVRNPTLAPQG